MSEVSKKNISQIMYFSSEDKFIARLGEDLRFTCAPAIHKVFCHLNHAKKNMLVMIDITQTKHIDSTVLGTIANFILAKKSRTLFKKTLPIILYQNKDIKKLFANTGIDVFFEWKKEDARMEQNLDKYEIVDASENNKKVLEKHVKDSHQTISRLQPAESDFSLVVKTLNKE